MVARLRWSLVLFLALTAALAAAWAGPLETVLEKHQAALDALSTQRTEKVTALEKWYANALETVRKQAMDKGNLDLVLAVKTEAARTQTTLTAEEMKSMPAPLPAIRQQLEQARAGIVTWHQNAVRTLTRERSAALEALEKRLTQNGQIEEALKVRTARSASTAVLDLPPPSAVLPAPSMPPPADSPAGTSAPAPGANRTVTISARIDARDDFIIFQNTLHIQHHTYAKPKNITVNGQPWIPEWKGDETANDFVFNPPLAPIGTGPVNATILSGRGKVVAAEQLSTADGQKLTVRFNDPQNGAAVSTIQISW